MVDAYDAVVFMRNPKVSKLARIQLGLGLTSILVALFVFAAGLPGAIPLAAAMMMIVVSAVTLSRENTPVCTIANNALEFKNPAPLASLQLIPLSSIQSVYREKRRFVVETSYQKKPVYMPVDLFKPDEIERVWSVLNRCVKPQSPEVAA